MYICRNSAFTQNTIDRNAYYRVAVLDYVYFHTNTERAYDYFYYTGGTATTHLTTHYRNILIDWLDNNHYDEGTQLNSSDFSNSSWNHDKTAFSFV